MVLPRHDCEMHLRQAPWTLWTRFDASHAAHPYVAELDAYLEEHRLPIDRGH